MPGTDRHFAAVSACHCGHRASVGTYCMDHAPIHALRLEILALRARLAGKEDSAVRIRPPRPEVSQEMR